jgi:hypothetical protein
MRCGPKCRKMTDIATGRQQRLPDLDKFPAAFSAAGEKQEKAADEETLILLQRFLGNPGVKKSEGRNLRGHKKSKSDSLMISMESTSPCDRRLLGRLTLGGSGKITVG